MAKVLARVLLVMLLVVTGAARPCAAPAATDTPLDRSLALLGQIDLQALAPAERQALLIGVADQLQGAGQPVRALDYLGRALGEAGTIPPETVLARIELLLAQLDRVSLEQVTVLYPDTLAAAKARQRLAAGDATGAVVVESAAPALGVLLPLSGKYAPFGELVRRGMELACGRSAAPVRLLFRDTAGSGDTVARDLEALAADPQVLAVLGPLTSAAAVPAAAAAERLGMPLLVLAQREGVAAPGAYLFRNALTASAQVTTLADFAVGASGLKRVAVLSPATRDGELFATLFRAALSERGGVPVAWQDYPAGALDLRDQLQKLAATIRIAGGADALFIPDEARQVAQIIPQLAFSRLDQLQLLGISSWNDPQLVRLSGAQVEGAVFVAGFFADSPWPAVRDFVASYQAAYDTVPNVLSAQGYDAARMLLTLLARPALRDRQTLRQALAALQDFPGVTGRTRFDHQGEAEKTLFLLQVQDGTVVQIN